MVTKEQQDWVDNFLAIGGDTIIATPSTDTPAAADQTGFPPVPIIIPVIIGGVKTLTGELICHVTMTNNTDNALTLDTSSVGELTHGEFKGPLPKGKLGPDGDSTAFTVHSISKTIPILGIDLSVTSAEATIRYFVGDDKTIWSCHFENPRILTDPLGTNNADARVDGPNAAGLQKPLANAEHGSEANFTFSLDGKGGGPPKPNGGGGTQTSCLVTIVNQTKFTLFLRKQEKASGDYMTNPAASLAPGASTEFAFVETPGSNQSEIRGLLTWEIGDPSAATWDLMWDNPVGAKNFTASFLKPDNGGFHSLEQIGQGDENVPVTFTLSGGGGTGPVPPAGKTTSCDITIKNNTKSVLTRSGGKSTSGAFTTEVAKRIDAGATVQMSCTSLPETAETGCVCSLEYTVGDDATASWAIDWNNPPGEGNAAHGTAAPVSAGFQSESSIGPGDEHVPVSFLLSGGGGDAPEQKDDAFAPPPKSKQPTLRVGDDSPDGWVEYAQRLLNKNKLNGPVDGKFDAAMGKKVRQFQGDNNLLVDGVIGNETWSILREGPRESVGTDGRKPHSFEQTNAQARFVIEKPESSGYNPGEDSYFNFIVSTGEQPIDKNKATVMVTQPDGTSHTHAFEIGPATSPSPDGQGNFHRLTIEGFSKKFAIKDPATVKDCTIDAYLDADIGGDRFTGPIPIQA